MDLNTIVQKTSSAILQNQYIRKCQELVRKYLEKPVLKAGEVGKNVSQEQPPGQAEVGPGRVSDNMG